MAIVQISRIQIRRGLNQDLPTLASAEMAWSIDTRQLYIGNGLLSEGAPTQGVTEILTEYSILNFTNTLTANVAMLQANVNTIQNEIGIPVSTTLYSPSGVVTTTTANNATISYTLSQGSIQRTGTIRMSRFPGSAAVTYDEEYDEVGGTSNIVFSFNANTTQANLSFVTTSTTNFLYTITSLT